jgi:hypothetical protein
MKALIVPFLAIMVALTFTAGPANAQFTSAQSPDMWSAPAGTGQEPFFRLENNGASYIAPNTTSGYFDAGNAMYLRRLMHGGGPGVGGDSGLSVLGQFP